MQLELKKLLEKLGVRQILLPYETQPWFHYDEEGDVSYSAEVRMGPNGDALEAELQSFREPDENESAEETGSAGSGDAVAHSPDVNKISAPEGQAQILRLRAEPVKDQLWTPVYLTVKGEDYVNSFHGWEEKGCDFFFSCVQSLQMGEVPDFDELIEKELSGRSGKGGGRGKIGRKSPKIKPAQLLGMKKPM